MVKAERVRKVKRRSEKRLYEVNWETVSILLWKRLDNRYNLLRSCSCKD